MEIERQKLKKLKKVFQDFSEKKKLKKCHCQLFLVKNEVKFEHRLTGHSIYILYIIYIWSVFAFPGKGTHDLDLVSCFQVFHFNLLHLEIFLQHPPKHPNLSPFILNVILQNNENLGQKPKAKDYWILNTFELTTEIVYLMQQNLSTNTMKSALLTAPRSRASKPNFAGISQ